MARTKFVLHGDAELTVEQIAAPALGEVAELVASSIVEKIPVQSGAVKAEYKTAVRADSTTDDGRPAAAVLIGSPRWHFLEYGTAFNPPYRPVMNGVAALGLRYESK